MTSESKAARSLGTGQFRTTRWSLVSAAGTGDVPARRALEELCAQYWPPLFAFARRSGHKAEDALDHTQGFFLDLLERNSIDRADRDRGRFRSFLLTCFTNYLANLRDAQRALKRGGGQVLLPLDTDSEIAERLYGTASEDDPASAFERRWALCVIDSVLEKLRGEYAARNRRPLCEALEGYLDGSEQQRTYKQMAEDLGISEGAVKVTVHRMRQRFGELLVEEVSQTLDQDGDPMEEIGALLGALGHR